MKKNMGRLDQTLRLVAAAAIAILLIAGVLKGTAAIVMAIVAAIFVITTLAGYCPLYKPLGISTKPKAKSGPSRIDV
jgi:Inner membrane protein YgaP-like, transmembrane domain